jgi:peptidoglycan/LPS O-acetylase OafA/YrhL
MPPSKFNRVVHVPTKRGHTRFMNKKRRKPKHAVHGVGRPAEEGGAIAAPATEQWPALNGLRGLAAFAVVCLHSYVLSGKPTSIPSPLAWLFAMGWSGVDVFFTLSAFLLTIPFLQAGSVDMSAPALRRYAWRRVVRILPAYYAQIAILLALGTIGVAGSWAWHDPKLSAVLAHLTFYVGAWPLVQPQLPPWWSLPVEMGFYLLLPLFVLCLRPGRWPWLLLAIGASLAYRFWLMHAGFTRIQEVFWIDHLPGRLHQFLIGMLAAYAYVRFKSITLPSYGRIRDMLAASALALFLTLPALGLLVGDNSFEGGPSSNPLLLCWHFFASLAVAVLLVTLVAGAPKMGQVFSWPPLQGLGLISYSLYLWHYPVMLGVREALGGFAAIQSDFWPFYFYSVLISVLVAIASWWLIERPAQQWGRRAKSTA